MARSPQWNVKGVDDETRDIARDAAAAAGLPIGAWIDRAVERGAKEEPAPRPAAEPVVPVGPAWEMPPDELALSSRRGSYGRNVRIAGAIAVVALLVGGAVWRLNEWAQTTQIAAVPEPAATDAPIVVPPAPQAAPQAQPASATKTVVPVESTEIESLRKAAEAGDAVAQYDLGVRYHHGQDVTHDPALAFFWFKRAAEQGHAQAEHSLAVAYADGKGTVQDFATAAQWFEKAAAAGVPESQYYLGVMYERGLGVPKNLGRALAMYRMAAGQGHKEAAERVAALTTAPAAGAQVPRLEDFTTANDAEIVPRTTVAEIQTLLARLDFDPGRADGVMGKKTEDAIAQYQAMAGMAEDGKPSATLLDDLRAVAGAAPR